MPGPDLPNAPKDMSTVTKTVASMVMEQRDAGLAELGNLADGCQRIELGIMPKSDKIIEQVNHPEHYGGDTVYEVIKVIQAWKLGFCLGNAVKYIGRAGKKDPAKEIQDLNKALWYVQERIKELQRE